MKSLKFAVVIFAMSLLPSSPPAQAEMQSWSVAALRVTTTDGSPTIRQTRPGGIRLSQDSCVRNWNRCMTNCTNKYGPETPKAMKCYDRCKAKWPC